MRACLKYLVFLIAANIFLLGSPVDSFGFNKSPQKKTNGLPTLDAKSNQYVPPPDVGPSQFYSPVSSMIKAGPVPALTRIFQPKVYEQAVWRYMFEYKETNVKQAQGPFLNKVIELFAPYDNNEF